MVCTTACPMIPALVAATGEVVPPPSEFRAPDGPAPAAWGRLENFDQRRMSHYVSTVKNACDLQTVESGTSEECYRHHITELTNAGVPTWERRVEEAAGEEAHGFSRKRVSQYLFGLDNGGENAGFMRRLYNILEGTMTVMFACVWCLQHQGHLVVKAMLKVLRVTCSLM